MKQRLLEEIQERLAQISDYGSLRELRDLVHGELQGHPLLSSPSEWNETVNALHDLLIRKAMMLAEEQTNKEAGFKSPVPYAFVLFGSGGRREQTLWSDQDNGLVYANPAPEHAAEAEAYFGKLAEIVEDGLCQIGYPPCEGNVSLNNPMWRRPMAEWIEMLDGWMGNPDWENVRYMLIHADMRCQYGDASLPDSLKEHFFNYLEAHRELLGDMLQNTLHRKASLGVLGNLIPERYGEDAGGIDIKYGSYIPIVNGIRLLAIQAGIGDSSTFGRMDRLLEKGVIGEAVWRQWKEAFGVVLKLRSLTPYYMENGYFASRGILPSSMLTKERKKELKFGLKTGLKLQRFVQKQIREEMEKGVTIRKKGDG